MRIFPGRSEKNSTAPKNARENSSRNRGVHLLSGRSCSRPMVKEVVAHRGMAKNGPMVR